MKRRGDGIGRQMRRGDGGRAEKRERGGEGKG